MGTVHSDIPFGSFEQLIIMKTIVALFVLVATTYAEAEAEADPMMMGGFPQAPAFRRPSGFIYSYQTYDNYPASTAPLTVLVVAPSEVPAEGTPQAIATPQFYNPYGGYGSFGGYPYGYGRGYGYPYGFGLNQVYNPAMPFGAPVVAPALVAAPAPVAEEIIE